MSFNKFAKAISKQFKKMSKHDMYVVDTNKDELWDVYMLAFPAGTNELYRERREYDCNHCKQFIKRVSNAVAIIDNKVVSVWDVPAESYYADVAAAMSAFVKARPISGIFLHNEPTVSREETFEQLPEGGVKTWNHYFCTIPAKFVERDLATIRGKAVTAQSVFKRGLDTIPLSALELVLELIADKALYRGEEHKAAITAFATLKRKYDQLETEEAKNIFTWQNYRDHSARFRNSVIGTLVQDIAKGINLEKAVRAFEAKVAPANYKRTSSVVTKGMITKALKKIDELGIEDSLQRRYATSEDLSINNVLFADRSTKMADKGSLEAILMASVKDSSKGLDNVPEISIEDFMKDVVPSATSIEALFKNSNISNLVSIIAPTHSDAPNILQWDNNFSWSYSGNVTDSMKEAVKAAGGKVDGDLRFSIQWNEDREDKNNDLDAHCRCPEGHIYFSNKKDRLDVDIQNPGNETAVENITWPNIAKMRNGEYDFSVNNYNGRNIKGFRAEIEMCGEIHTFDCSKRVTNPVEVATVILKDGKFSIKPSMKSGMTPKTEWGISTEKFHKVDLMMLSPNHWDDNETGNKHYFFALHGCNNPEDARGLYTEFLAGKLVEHRKVFEMLGDKLKCTHTDEQLSGLGFSSTQRNELIVRVKGSTNKTLKIKF